MPRIKAIAAILWAGKITRRQETGFKKKESEFLSIT